MENKPSKQDELRAEKQDTVSLENEENVKKAAMKTVVSIRDVIERHPTSKAIYDIPFDEQQYNDGAKINDDD